MKTKLFSSQSPGHFKLILNLKHTHTHIHTNQIRYSTSRCKKNTIPTWPSDDLDNAHASKGQLKGVKMTRRAAHALVCSTIQNGAADTNQLLGCHWGARFRGWSKLFIGPKLTVLFC